MERLDESSWYLDPSETGLARTEVFKLAVFAFFLSELAVLYLKYTSMFIGLQNDYRDLLWRRRSIIFLYYFL